MTAPSSTVTAESVLLFTGPLRRAAGMLHPLVGVPELTELVLHFLRVCAGKARADGLHCDAERLDRLVECLTAAHYFTRAVDAYDRAEPVTDHTRPRTLSGPSVGAAGFDALVDGLVPDPRTQASRPR
ncbi:hypothetical protein [Cryptosporangium minutisporangium]|uniref:Uncharacterized protein n=1 Tax=Cryptosporangium minutisporangium TaxID=113569 RepID=A0ABP6T787_9ACTN